ncbi:hypothetical protein MSG28_015842 [Choristoneura fumiferana]|uniref:Uncharacterized protein n=1 Tax=Choristoneura fumiferana TaxID=7141 RepID=A0ACC0K503_CHOFU|nr:hypothetical protein MSG28_015842 [Choristoneura fumiferana]
MWDVRACRGCLTVSGKLEKISDGCKRLYTTLTGLQIADGDGYPHYFCLECRTMVKKCLAFRRKSRRAHFVMKEIMSVRKQVTYSDIITVNRKKTNLNSSLGFWEPQKTHSIVITEAEKPQHELEPTGPFYTRVVDIKPDNAEETLAPSEQNEETNELNDAPYDDDFNDDMNIKEELLDIDLNDVFKDLKEDVDEAQSPEPDEIEPVKEEVVDIMSQKISKMSVHGLLQVLESCDIRVLSLADQIERMEIRRRSKEFAHALYKCSMCLTIHDSMQGLVEHVTYHNSRRFNHDCVVCRNKYPTVEDLNIHVARCHMYEYTCKCNVKRYSLHDIVKHNKCCEYLIRKRIEETTRRQQARKIWRPMDCFTILSLTHNMMHHVRALRELWEGKVYPEPEVITENHCKCDICGKWVKNKVKMEEHMQIRHKYLYTCNYCKEVFTERLPALQHANNTHRAVEKPWSCEECDATFKDYRGLSLHRYKHNTKITCNLCGQLFNSTKMYYKHQLTEHKYISLNDPLVGDPQYRCSDCGIQFIDKRSLETHLVLLNHAGASDIELACLPCKKLFENEDQLETHYITCKAAKYPRQCCYCPEILKDKLQYVRHYNTQHPTLHYRYTTKNAICDICGKSIHKKHLEAHLKLHASDSHYCRLCGATSMTPATHVTHMLCHASKPYLCALCPRRFQHKGDARDHILKVHAPTKLYKCEFCVQEFSYFRNLREHSQKLHDLVIPKVKNKCKRSKTKLFVYAHMKIEINEGEREVLEKTDVCLLDYLDQKSKPVDYKDYFVFTEDCDQILRVKKKMPMPKPEKLKVPKVEIESDIILKPAGDGDVKDEVKTMKMEARMEFEEANETENAVRGIAEDNVKMEQEMVIDEERPLAVFENEGKQFVVLHGEVYRIAMDDEE